MKLCNYSNLLIASLLLLLAIGCSDPAVPFINDPPTYPIIDSYPCWSPNGETIAYYHYGITFVDSSGVYDIDSDSVGIWYIGADGSNPRLVINGATMLDWSPDGNKIAFSYGSQIFNAKSDGSEVNKLTNEGSNYSPDWSPDGLLIAFDSSMESPTGSNVIWIMDQNGNNKIRIDEFGEGERREPDWNPSGNRLAHLRYIGIGFPEIHTMSTGGTELVRLTENSAYDGSPIHSPDGSKIAYYKHYAGEYPQIWIMDSNGENDRRLTSKGGIYPSWSADGLQLVYVRFSSKLFDSEHGTLWIKDLDGSNEWQLTASPVK